MKNLRGKETSSSGLLPHCRTVLKLPYPFYMLAPHHIQNKHCLLQPGILLRSCESSDQVPTNPAVLFHPSHPCWPFQNLLTISPIETPTLNHLHLFWK